MFLEDIGDLPQKRNMEFVINLVPGTSLMSTTLYQMFATELSELKKKLEDFLEKKFIRPSSRRGVSHYY